MLSRVKKLRRDLHALIFPQKAGVRDYANIITPEILNDKFSEFLNAYSKNNKFKTFLEIGSSSGTGSTRSIVEGIQTRGDKEDCLLICMEVSQTRFLTLKAAYEGNVFFKPFQLSSVSIRKYPSWLKVLNFYYTRNSKLRTHSIVSVLSWLRKEKGYLKASGINLEIDGISECKKKFGIEKFDFVLIDGSEFTGLEELKMVWGAKVIFLDDTDSYKNWHAFELLESSPEYRLIFESRTLRNGFAVFEFCESLSRD